MENNTSISFFAAEVKEVVYTDTEANTIYGVRVRAMGDPGPTNNIDDATVQTAIPLNYNFVRVPIVGEVVLCLRAPSAYQTGTRSQQNLYYLDVVSLQSSVHHNGIPTVTDVKAAPNTSNSDGYEQSSAGNTNKQQPPSIDPNFTEISTAKPLQHYVGDVILEGRYGQSIRLSSSPKSGEFAVPPKFSGASGKPITIFKNTTQGNDTKRINDFVTEDFTNEENVFVLASGQNLEFEQASTSLKSADSKGITSWKDENWGTTPQALLSSGRIVFNSTQQEIIAFAKNGIGLSSETVITIDAKDNVSINADKIELGTDADEPIILGNKFKSWAESLIDDLAKLVVITPVGPSSPLSASPQWASIMAYKAQIPSILSDIAFSMKTSSGKSGSAKFKDIPAPNFVLTPEQIEEKKEEKAKVEEKLQETELNQDERNALADVANRAEQEIKTKEAVKAEVVTTLSAEDITENAAEITSTIQTGTVDPTDPVLDEDFQPEGELTPPLSEEELEAGNTPGAEEELAQWVQDYEVDEDEEDDEEVEFEFLDTPYVSPGATTFAASSLWVVPKLIQDYGKAIALAVSKEIEFGLEENPSGSFGLGNDRIAAMMANVNCRPGNSPWHAAAVATYFKEADISIVPPAEETGAEVTTENNEASGSEATSPATQPTVGVPIPTEGASTVTGWLDWGRKTNRFVLTPVMGSAVIIGTIEEDPNESGKRLETATDIGITVQIIDNERVMAALVTQGVLKLVEVNVQSTLGFILPADKDLDPIPWTPAGTSGPLPEGKPGYVIVYSKSNPEKRHVVFQQGSGAQPGRPGGTNPSSKVPWNNLVYGTAGQSTIAGGGCGICSTSAVVRNLTGNQEVDAYLFGLRFGGHDYGPPEDAKKYPKDSKNYHAAGPGGGNGSYRTIMTEVPQKYGLKTKSNPTKEEAIAVFQKGGYMLGVGSGEKPFSGGGHYVYFFDYHQGKFYCGNSVLAWNNQGYTWEHIKKQSNVQLVLVWSDNPPVDPMQRQGPQVSLESPPETDLPPGEGVDGVPGDLIAAMKKFGITNKLEKAHFLSQCAHESGNFKWKTEFASGAAYEGRSDLGNNRAGDGKRYKGRGYIQITGRSNYTTINTWMKQNGYNDDVVANPELLATKYPALSAVWFWTQQQGVKQFPSKAKEGATSAVVEKITRWINGGTNGLDDRKKKFSFYWDKLKDNNPDPYV